VVCLAGLADGAGDAQLALQLVAGVAEAGLELRPPGIGPAVRLARLARDVVRGITQCGHLLILDALLLRAEQRLLKFRSARTEGVLWTQNTLSVEPVVAVVRPTSIVGVEPQSARLALLTDHVARGVALVSYVSVAKF